MRSDKDYLKSIHGVVSKEAVTDRIMFAETVDGKKRFYIDKGAKCLVATARNFKKYLRAIQRNDIRERAKKNHIAFYRGIPLIKRSKFNGT